MIPLSKRTLWAIVRKVRSKVKVSHDTASMMLKGLKRLELRQSNLKFPQVFECNFFPQISFNCSVKTEDQTNTGHPTEHLNNNISDRDQHSDKKKDHT